MQLQLELVEETVTSQSNALFCQVDPNKRRFDSLESKLRLQTGEATGRYAAIAPEDCSITPTD